MIGVGDRVPGNDGEEEYTTLEDSVTSVGIGPTGVGIGLDNLPEITVAIGVAGVLEVPGIESGEKETVIDLD